MCLDLEKFDEAIQACEMLIDLKQSLSAQAIPDPEEKCVKGIVGGIVEAYASAQRNSDKVALDASRRSLPRVHNLLERIRVNRNDPWIFETMAYFHAEVGQDAHVFENLMKEYRSLTSVRAWEKDDNQVRKVSQVVSQIVHYQGRGKEDLLKSKFLLSGIVKRIEKARSDMRTTNSEEVKAIHTLLQGILAELDKMK